MEFSQSMIKRPVSKDLFMRTVKNSTRLSTHSRNNFAGIGSNSQDFGASEKMILRMVSWVTWLK